MKQLFTSLAILLLSSSVFAQEITKQEKGYFNLTELGYLVSKNKISVKGPNGNVTQSNSAFALSLRNINGWFINNSVSLGIGVGLDGYTYSQSNSIYDNTFLLFADARYYLKNDTKTFFGYADLGSSVAIDNNIASGLFYNFGAGYKFKVGAKTAMNGSIGYNHQKINHDSSPYKDRYSSLAIKIGLLL